MLAHLGEAEKESDPSYKAESLSSMFLDLIRTGPTGVVGEASLQENKTNNTQAKANELYGYSSNDSILTTEKPSIYLNMLKCNRRSIS